MENTPRTAGEPAAKTAEVFMASYLHGYKLCEFPGRKRFYGKTSICKCNENRERTCGGNRFFRKFVTPAGDDSGNFSAGGNIGYHIDN